MTKVYAVKLISYWGPNGSFFKQQNMIELSLFSLVAMFSLVMRGFFCDHNIVFNLKTAFQNEVD